jgi:hypothetical protein
LYQSLRQAQHRQQKRTASLFKSKDCQNPTEIPNPTNYSVDRFSSDPATASLLFSDTTSVEASIKAHIEKQTQVLKTFQLEYMQEPEAQNQELVLADKYS